MNSNPAWLASRTIVAVKVNGQATNVTLRIGTPYEVSPDEWACPVAMEGMHGRLVDVHGIDAWQALQLAQSLQAQLLGYFVEDGGKLFCHEPPQPIGLAELFPSIRPPAGETEN
jgi:hypothetical protein